MEQEKSCYNSHVLLEGFKKFLKEVICSLRNQQQKQIDVLLQMHPCLSNSSREGKQNQGKAPVKSTCVQTPAGVLRYTLTQGFRVTMESKLG